jgi:hypothetical protein
MTDRDDAMEAMEMAVSALEELHASADNAAIAGKREQEIVHDYTDTVAHALADGVNDAVGLYAGTVAEETVYYSKTDIKQKIQDRVESVCLDDKPPLDEFVEDELESVTVTKTTDQHQGAIYTWDFGEFKVETKSGADRRQHFSFPSFRDFIFESGGHNVGTPTEDRRDGADWRDFIVDIVDKRGKVQTNVGPRTAAKEKLANKIRRRVAYGTAEGAVDHSGVWVITQQPVPDEWSLPDWWAPLICEMHQPLNQERALDSGCIETREIRVHESVIVPLVDDAEITRSALYHELDARNLTIPGVPGTSLTEWVNGRTERFWALRPDIAMPDVYVPDATQSCGFRHFGDIETDALDADADTDTRQATADGGSVNDDTDDTGSGSFASVGGDDGE